MDGDVVFDNWEGEELLLCCRGYGTPSPNCRPALGPLNSTPHRRRTRESGSVRLDVPKELVGEDGGRRTNAIVLEEEEEEPADFGRFWGDEKAMAADCAAALALRTVVGEVREAIVCRSSVPYEPGPTVVGLYLTGMAETTSTSERIIPSWFMKRGVSEKNDIWEFTN